MATGELSPSSRAFMETLWERTAGETSRQMSMYDVGAALGLNREDSAQAAEDLMGLGLVEIRTLSGGIGVTAAAVERFRAPAAVTPPVEPGLGPGPVLADAPREHLETLLGHLKHHLAGERREFDALAELVADLRSLDAQLASPRPKTAVLRACLEALGEDCRGAGEPEWASRLKHLLERS